MHSLGACTIKTPFLRAIEITSFIKGAISATLAAAPLHQCWSHMSQIMIAVSADFHSCISLAIYHEPFSRSEDSLFCIEIFSCGILSCGCACNDGVNSSKKKINKKHKIKSVFFIAVML